MGGSQIDSFAARELGQWGAAEQASAREKVDQIKHLLLSDSSLGEEDRAWIRAEFDDVRKSIEKRDLIQWVRLAIGTLYVISGCVDSEFIEKAMNILKGFVTELLDSLPFKRCSVKGVLLNHAS